MTIREIKNATYDLALNYQKSKVGSSRVKNPFKGLKQSQRDLLIEVLNAKDDFDGFDSGALTNLQTRLTHNKWKRGEGGLKGFSRSIQNVFGRTSSKKVQDKVYKIMAIKSIERASQDGLL